MINGVVSIPLPGEALDLAPRPGEAAFCPALAEFIVGPENRQVEGAVRALLGETPSAVPLLVFYGPSGAGKTHLVWSLVRAFRAPQPRRMTMFADATEFARQLADAIETQAVEEFRRRYRSPALLVLEDLDRLQTKPAAQQELQHTLDVLLRSGRRAVLTACQAPPRLTGLSPALRSRLAQGLNIPLAMPEAPARHALVQRIARQRGLPLGEETINLLADGLRGPVPELLGALTQLQAEAELEGRPVDLAAVRSLVARRRLSAAPRLQQIASTTARYFAVRVSDMRSPTRRRPVVTARGVAMYLARLLTDESFRQIGQYFGGRDHTTILHGYRKTEQLLKTQPQIQKAVFDLQEKLTNS